MAIDLCHSAAMLSLRTKKKTLFSHGKPCTEFALVVSCRAKTKLFILPRLNVALREKGFSDSLIIHQEKTKKITTVTVVWISDPNYHKILPTLALNFSKNY